MRSSILSNQRMLIHLYVILQYSPMISSILKYEPHHEKIWSRVSNQVRHKPGCTTTDDGLKLWIKRDCTIYEVKTKASCTVAAQLICSLFSHMEKTGFLMKRIILNMTIYDVYRPSLVGCTSGIRRSQVLVTGLWSPRSRPTTHQRC